MELLTDSKHLKIELNHIERRIVYEQIVKKYGYTTDDHYSYVVRDKRHGVFLGHFPKAPYANYTTSLIFHGYSNGSKLLEDIFKLISLRRWKARRIDIALDTDIPYDHLYAIHPPKRADVERYKTSVYLGSHSSPVQLHMYDKQAQLYDTRREKTDDWRRIELRFRFEPMRKVSDLSIEDFAAAMDYTIIPDIDGMPQKLHDTVIQLNRGIKEWGEVTRTTQKKIREYGCEHGLNMFDHILSNVTDIQSFIYTSSVDYQRISI